MKKIAILVLISVLPACATLNEPNYNKYSCKQLEKEISAHEQQQSLARDAMKTALTAYMVTQNYAFYAEDEKEYNAKLNAYKEKGC